MAADRAARHRPCGAPCDWLLFYPPPQNIASWALEVRDDEVLADVVDAAIHLACISLVGAGTADTLLEEAVRHIARSSLQMFTGEQPSIPYVSCEPIARRRIVPRAHQLTNGIIYPGPVLTAKARLAARRKAPLRKSIQIGPTPRNDAHVPRWDVYDGPWLRYDVISRVAHAGSASSHGSQSPGPDAERATFLLGVVAVLVAQRPVLIGHFNQTLGYLPYQPTAARRYDAPASILRKPLPALWPQAVNFP
jgi:hypothetical protein